MLTIMIGLSIYERAEEDVGVEDDYVWILRYIVEPGKAMMATLSNKTYPVTAWTIAPDMRVTFYEIETRVRTVSLSELTLFPKSSTTSNSKISEINLPLT